MTDQSISKRFNRSIIIIVVSLLMLFSLGAVIYGVNRMDEQLDEQINYASNLALTSLPNAIWNMDDKSINEILNALFLDENIVYLAVLADGEILNKKVRSDFEKMDFAFFQNSSRFVLKENPILNQEEEIGKVRIVLSKEAFKSELKKQIIAIIMLSLILIGLITLRSMKISQKLIFQPLAGLESSASSIASGDLDAKISYEANDEIGRLSRSFNTMRESVKKLITDLNAVNKDLEQRVEKRTEELARSTEELRNAKEKAETSGNYKAALNQLTIIMQDAQDVSELSKQVSRYLSDFLELPLAAFFALNGNNKLKRFADFGYPHKNNLPDLISIGSGLIGQAAAEGKSITLKNIPDYARASFGFGEASPEEILLFPLIYNNQTIGVLELGSFKSLTDSQRIWIEEAGRSISIVLRSTLDIEERKHKEEMYKESERRLELALEAGDLGFWDVDFKTMKTVVNKRWAEMLGYSFEEIKDVYEIWKKTIHPDDQERVFMAGKKYREGKIPAYELEYRVLTKQKNIKWVISKGAIVAHDDQGVPVRMVGTIMDITESKKDDKKT